MDALPLAEHFFAVQLQLSSWASVLGGLIAVFLSVFFSRQITAPIRQLTFGADQVARRNFQYKIRVETGDELQGLAQSFNALSSELSRYESLQKQWLMDISHELRTPLTILISEISAILDNLTQCDLHAIGSINEEVMRIKRLVDDLHDLSVMDQVGFGLNKAQTDLGKLIDGQLLRYKDTFASNELTLPRELPAASTTVFADGDRLAQVLRNLLENCLRYTHRPGSVWVRLRRDGTTAVLTVEDSGPGVSAEALPRLFDRLYRAEHSRNRITGGTGLGLTICKTIVLAHGGEIVAEHSERGGLCIRITLPLTAGAQS